MKLLKQSRPDCNASRLQRSAVALRACPVSCSALRRTPLPPLSSLIFPSSFCQVHNLLHLPEEPLFPPATYPQPKRYHTRPPSSLFNTTLLAPSPSGSLSLPLSIVVIAHPVASDRNLRTSQTTIHPQTSLNHHRKHVQLPLRRAALLFCHPVTLLALAQPPRPQPSRTAHLVRTECAPPTIQQGTAQPQGGSSDPDVQRIHEGSRGS